MDLEIRKATIDDAYILAEILSKSWMSAYKEIIPINELKQHANIDRKYELFKSKLLNQEIELYIVFESGSPCGEFMLCNSRDEDLPEYGEIVSIYNLPEYWDKGIGSEMMTFILNRMRELNYNNILLWVFKRNERARKFLRNSHFALIELKKQVFSAMAKLKSDILLILLNCFIMTGVFEEETC